MSTERTVRPLVLSADRREGGQLAVRVRLSTGRVVEGLLPHGELGEELLALLDPQLVRVLEPGRRSASP